MSNNLRAFKGKVVSGYGLYLTRRNKQYFLSTEKLNESDNRVWEIVDAELDEKLKKHAPKIYKNLGRGVCCSPKIKLLDNETILELIGAKFYKFDREYNEIPLDEWKVEKVTVSKIRGPV